MEKNDAISCDLDMEIVKLQQLSDSMYEELYKHTNYVLEELPPFDLNENKQLHIYGPNYPPHGEVVYPMVNMNSLYYAVRTNLLATWLPCKITERTDAASVDGVSFLSKSFHLQSIVDFQSFFFYFREVNSTCSSYERKEFLTKLYAQIIWHMVLHQMFA